MRQMVDILHLHKSPATSNDDDNSTKLPFLDNREAEFSICSQAISSLTSDRFQGIQSAYRENVENSRRFEAGLKSIITRLNRQYKYLKPIDIIPFAKRKLEKVAEQLRYCHDLLSSKSYTPQIPISNFTSCTRGLQNISISGYSFVFGELSKYIDYDSRAFGDHQAKPFFNVDSSIIISLNCQYLQLHLLSHCLILMSRTDFAVIDYRDIHFSYTTHIATEADIESLGDVKVIREEWAHARVNGKQDRRHKFNYRLYIVEYGLLEIDIQNRFTVKVLFNNYDKGYDLCKILAEVGAKGNNPTPRVTLQKRSCPKKE